MRKVVMTPDLVRRVSADSRFRAALAAPGTPQWREVGACVSAEYPDVFFPLDNEFDHVEPARSVCRSCPVLGECLADALGRSDIEGVWGATTAAERRTMRAVWRHETIGGTGAPRVRAAASS